MVRSKKERARAFSSAGSEHLPYKQRVGGSNPSTPTQRKSYRGLKQTSFLLPVCVGNAAFGRRENDTYQSFTKRVADLSP